MSNLLKATQSGCPCLFKKAESLLNPGPSKPRGNAISPQISSSIAAGNVDKRVALTVSPKTYQRDETLYADKIIRVLGEQKYKKSWIKDGFYFYGLLRNALGTSSGLIFPYTPTVSFNHQTNYSQVDIIHSNMTYNYYKNSPPPNINIEAKFTADNRDNALHMLSAIWFLVACSKCEFGEKSKYAGLPPPILYLNGYDHLMDNIPVVITSVRYSYPETKHYVNLVLDFSQEYKHRGSAWKGGDTTFDSANFCKIYTTSTSTITEEKEMVDYVVDDFVVEPREMGVEGTQKANYNDDGIIYSFWLPTDIQISIGLAVQPNLIKTRKQWSLEGYKSGILLANDGKNPPVSIAGIINEKEVSEINSFTLKDPNNPGNDTSSKSCNQPCPCADSRETLNFIPSGWTW